MKKEVYDTYVSLLHKELTMATGCTEPIAIAYAGARLRAALGAIPEHCTVYCSGNIVKNVMAVTVPNSGGAKGIDTDMVPGVDVGLLDGQLTYRQHHGGHEAGPNWPIFLDLFQREVVGKKQ